MHGVNKLLSIQVEEMYGLWKFEHNQNVHKKKVH